MGLANVCSFFHRQVEPPWKRKLLWALTIDGSLLVNFVISYVSAGRSQESGAGSFHGYIEKRDEKRAINPAGVRGISEIIPVGSSRDARQMEGVAAD